MRLQLLTLTVKAVAADSNAQEDTATVTINVKQPDTANPIIADATVTPLESIAAGTTIIDINDTSGNGSTDTDGDGKALTYSIIAGNDDGLFALNQSTGVITLATGKSLDYEASPSHTLVVQAAESDGSGTDTAVITINVGNVNEHAPEIEDISVDALESIDDTDVIVDLSEKTTGNDTDQDQSALTYSITAGNDGGLFTINQNTGVIKLAATKSLDYATATSHTLTVKAVAADSNTQEDTATVTINVKQPDTANPIIADATVAPLESIAAGTTIIDINDSSGNGSTDTDGDGKALTYSIIAGNDDGLFALNQSTGVIKLATGKSLDYETSPSHTLVVQAAESDR